MKRIILRNRRPKMRALDGKVLTCREPRLYEPHRTCHAPAHYPDMKCYRHTEWLHGTLNQRKWADYCKVRGVPSEAKREAWARFAEWLNPSLKLPEKRQ